MNKTLETNEETEVILSLSEIDRNWRNFIRNYEDGLMHKAEIHGANLSGGQKQRVAIARAMAMDPSIILADEPTGALDSETGRMVMDLFHKLHKEKGKTIILITHSPELAEETERVITIKDGLITGERPGGGQRC